MPLGDSRRARATAGAPARHAGAGLLRGTELARRGGAPGCIGGLYAPLLLSRPGASTGLGPTRRLARARRAAAGASSSGARRADTIALQQPIELVSRQTELRGCAP